MGGDDLAAFYDVVSAGHRLVYEPAAIVLHQHYRDYAALRRQTYGYGAGLGAHLTRCLIADPRLVVALALSAPDRAAPGRRTIVRPPVVGGLPPYPADLSRQQLRGLVSGPVALPAQPPARPPGGGMTMTDDVPGPSRHRCDPGAAVPLGQRHPGRQVRPLHGDPRPAGGPPGPDAGAGLPADHRAASCWTAWPRASCRRAPVVLTFDDGFADFAANAWPLLTDRGLAATLYVTAGDLGGRSEWLASAGVRLPMLTPREIADLAADGCEIGAHSMTHPHLDCLPHAVAYEEIRHSKDVLEQVLGQAVDTFAYPHGYHSRATKELVMAAGYRSATAVRNALSHADDDRYAIARVTVTSDFGTADLARVLTGTGVRTAGPRESWQTSVWRQARRLARPSEQDGLGAGRR